MSLYVQADPARPKWNKELAQELQAEIDIQLLRGTFDPDEWRNRLSGQTATVFQFIEIVFKHMQNSPQDYKKKTLQHYYFNLRKLEKIMGKNLPIGKFTAEHVRKHILPALQEGVKYNTYRSTVIDLKALWNLGMRLGYVEFNPFVGITTKPQRSAPRFFTLSEVNKIRADLSVSDRPAWYKQIVFLGLNTGLRKEELVTLRKNNVFLEENMFVVRGKGKYSGKERIVPLLSPAREILTERMETPGELVFDDVSYWGLDSMWKRSRDRTGIEGGIHKWRKTFASYWMMSGRHIYSLKEILGHETLQELMIYAALSPDALLQGKKWDGFEC